MPISIILSQVFRTKRMPFDLFSLVRSPFQSQHSRTEVAVLFGFAMVLLALPAERVWAQKTPSKAKSTLSPEERAAAKQLEADRKMKLAQLRRDTFGIVPQDDNSALAVEYRNAFESFRSAMTDMDEVQCRLQVEPNPNTPKRDVFFLEWCKGLEIANKARETWLVKASELYASDTDKYASIANTLIEMLNADVKLDRFDPWLVPCKALIHAGKNQDETFLQSAGFVALAHNDFDLLEQCWIPLQQQGILSPMEISLLSQVDMLRASWAREQTFREEDEKRGDNPQVELLTSKGRIVIELFEDSAPEAVNSFIYLVEKRFYDNKAFFRVEQHTCAQSGCEKGDGSSNAGYVFAGEAKRENRRDHFRGTVSIALGVEEGTGIVNQNSGGSQFFFSVLPLLHLNEDFTVFGRIIQGQPTINLLRVMNLTEEKERKDTSKNPDFILSAKVIRKRDHEYKPNPLAGKLYR